MLKLLRLRGVLTGCVVSIAGAAVAYSGYFTHSVSTRFDDIFCGSTASKKKKDQDFLIYDREGFQQELAHRLSYLHPKGIIFVSGRLNGGKTTTIQATLANRKHVACINWRGSKVLSSTDLNNHLKEAFRIKTFKDYITSVYFRPGLILGTLLNWLPHLDFQDNEMKELSKTQEIENVLKYAHRNCDLSCRPVIFIDEIGALQGLIDEKQNEVAKQFLQWMVKISKDEKLCDIILASHNGFTYETLRGTSMDSQYCSSMVIPDFNDEDLVKIANEFKTKNGKVPSDVLEKVGGHAGHIIELYAQSVHSQRAMEKTLLSFEESEKATLDLARKYGKTSCTSWFREREWNCYTNDELKKVLDLFLKDKHQTSLDPEIPLDTVVRESGVDKRVLKKFVNSDYLFFDPEKHTLKTRTKLFLHVYEVDQNKAAKIKDLDQTRRREVRILEDKESYTYEKEEARKRLNDINKQLRELGA